MARGLRTELELADLIGKGRVKIAASCGNRSYGDVLADTYTAAILPLRTLQFVLPMPPSVNDLYRVDLETGMRYLVDEQRKFRRDVIYLVRGSMRGADALCGRLDMRIMLFFCDHRRSDISNRVKALEDALTHAHAYRDDSQIDKQFVERVIRPTSKREECSVVIQEIEA